MGIQASAQIDPGRVTQFELDTLVEAKDRLPEDSTVRDFLQAILEAGQRNVSVTALAQDVELSPNEAAKLLGMSRPHLLKFIRSGALKCRLVGSHQRIAVEDFLDFKARREAASKEVAQALASDARASRQITLTDDEMAELDAL